MIGLLLKIFNPLGGIAREIARWRAAEIDAESEQDRIEATVRVQQLEARQAALIGGEASWVSKAVLVSLSAPFVLYTWKLIVWDKMLGLGSTDPLSPFLENLCFIIAGFYFLAISGRGLIRSFKRAL